MKIILPTLIFLFIALTGKSQIISQFTWNSNPIYKADAGPDAISYSSLATSSPNGKTGNGLNAGPNRQDINLVLPGSYFDVLGIDISVDFRREESDAQFFTRGNFVFGMHGGSLFATYPVVNGNSYTSINTGDVYSLPGDKIFHTYRFRYNDATGVATISVDGTNVFTTTAAKATAGKSLYWTNAGDATIGVVMDGSANNIAILDNLVIQKVPPQAVLPLKLLSFTAALKGSYATINWSTTLEANVSNYTIERSSNGLNFSAIKSVKAVNSYGTTNRYQSTDSVPVAPYSYYRLKMTDADGSYTYSEVKKVELSVANVTVSCFPNPSVDYVNLRISSDKAASYAYTVTALDGKTLIASSARLSAGAQLLSIDLTKTTVKGVVIVQLQNTSDNTKQIFKIVKQ